MLPVADPGLAAIGQDNLVVTPLQMSLALASLARGGELQQARLVAAVQNEVGEWQAIPHDSQAVEVLTLAMFPEMSRTVVPLAGRLKNLGAPDRFELEVR